MAPAACCGQGQSNKTSPVQFAQGMALQWPLPSPPVHCSMPRACREGRAAAPGVLAHPSGGVRFSDLVNFQGLEGLATCSSPLQHGQPGVMPAGAACRVTCTKVESAATGVGMQLTGLHTWPPPWLAHLPRLCELQLQPCSARHVSMDVSKIWLCVQNPISTAASAGLVHTCHPHHQPGLTTKPAC